MLRNTNTRGNNLPNNLRYLTNQERNTLATLIFFSALLLAAGINNLRSGKTESALLISIMGFVMGFASQILYSSYRRNFFSNDAQERRNQIEQSQSLAQLHQSQANNSEVRTTLNNNKPQ